MQLGIVIWDDINVKLASIIGESCDVIDKKLLVTTPIVSVNLENALGVFAFLQKSCARHIASEDLIFDGENDTMSLSLYLKFHKVQYF